VSIDKSKHFGSFGDQLQAIFNHYASKGSSTDNRLVRAPTGAGEVDPTGGGFLVQVDFAATIFMLAHDMGDILSRVTAIPISANANGIKIPGVDETSRATGSRWGGVASNWAAEGTAGTESRPKFRLVEFDLKKLISKMTMTDELLQDSTALTSIASMAFSEEVMFMTEDAIIEGSGVGQPLGYPQLAGADFRSRRRRARLRRPSSRKTSTRCGPAAGAGRARTRSGRSTRTSSRSSQALNGAVGTGGARLHAAGRHFRRAVYASL
jgi:HK97 family phage major capsid protein